MREGDAMERRKAIFGDAHPDMRRYLEEGCYCPGEIYDTNGMMYLRFRPDGDCVICEQGDGMTVVIAASDQAPSRPQAIMFWHDEPSEPGRIIAAQRVDATDNNIGILCDIARGVGVRGRRLDGFPSSTDAEDAARLLSMADAVAIG